MGIVILWIKKINNKHPFLWDFIILLNKGKNILFQYLKNKIK